VWLIARADSPIKPIEPSGDIETDIHRVKNLLAGRSVLTMAGTCLDPSLYGLASTQAEIRFYTASENLNEIAPAIINGAAEATLLDVPDALVALQAWPGDIKIIGPISSNQFMGAAVAKSSPELLAAFNRFFEDLRTSGAYDELVKKYYPSVYLYLATFSNLRKENNKMTKTINQRQYSLVIQRYPLTASRCHSVVSMMLCVLILALSMPGTQAFGGDLEDVLKAGKLRHLGIPYANFVSNQGDGLDVEVMKLFATYLGVKYEADSILNPITPTGDILKDIEAVKSGLQGASVLAMKDSCLYHPDFFKK
jgi:ABC-type amino acid transport substrate-binding protein